VTDQDCLTIEGPALDGDPEALPIDLEGFEGPLHLLLELARAQKVDLARISMAALADAFLTFVADARGRRIELAADFLVMAAWLAWLKSRLLLPKPVKPSDEPDPDHESARLRAKLANLAAAREAARRLEALDQVNRDVFLQGNPAPIAVVETVRFKASLGELLAAYGRQRSAGLLRRHQLSARTVYPIADARRRLKDMAPALKDWTPLTEISAAAPGRAEAGMASVTASTFGAALELARDGVLDLHQDAYGAPLLLKGRA
jgi:segregation and condensation protein A